MIRLRQVAFAARDLAAAEDELTEALCVQLCFRDPGVAAFGLHNGLFPVGDQFLEIVSPIAQGTTAGRLLDKLGGDCGYMAIFQTDDLAAAERRFADIGARVVFDATGEGIRGLHLHPKDVPGAIVSIDQPDEPAEWPWAGPSWRASVDTSVVHAITGLTIAADDVDAATERWAHVLGVPRRGRAIDIDGATIRFTPTVAGEPPRLAGIVLATNDEVHRGARTRLLGTDVEFV
jgi:hypothetical protein